MILAKLAAATIVVAAAAGPLDPTGAVRELSLPQKNVAMRPYLKAATDCVARTVMGDARFRRDGPSPDLGDLIVDSMPKCLGPVRAMIDAYDRHFGAGAGEAFFMGPYLDALPRAVGKLSVEMAR
jgi:hypothetical protein